MAAEDDTTLYFNGIDAATGAYAFDPMRLGELAEVAKGNALDRATHDENHLAELQSRHRTKNEKHYGVKEGIDATKLEQAGWGVIFPFVRAGSDEAKEQDAIHEALSPLLALRRAQATQLDERFYKEYRGLLAHRPGESKQKYLARLGAGPGPADPAKVPYFLLIVGSPQIIPFHVQYQIDVQYAVGRIHFDTIAEYANYARSVVAAETGGLALSRELAFVGVANPNDAATQLSRAHLVGPLADKAEAWGSARGWKVSRYFDGDASKASVSQLLGGPRTPALLFSGSHGVSFGRGDPLQERRQGALLLQDWGGPGNGPIGEDLYLSGDDIRSDAGLLGLISFNFACYGAGTPEHDEFSKQAFKERKPIADRAFVAGLHRKLLGHPKGGALATIGHVERAWGSSFMWGTGPKGAQAPQLTVFSSTLEALMKGVPVGVALEYFNERYAELASDLSQQLEELDFNPDAVDDYTIADMWTSSNDARGYAVIGDPAVRLQLADAKHDERSRASIDVAALVSVSPTAILPAAEPATDADPEHAAPAAALTSFGLHGGPASPTQPPGSISELLEALGKPLEVRTYVSGDIRAAAALDRATLAQDGELVAFTRINPNGDMDVILPPPGGIDAAAWERHVAMVEQARQGRAALQEAVLSTSASGGKITRPPDS